MNPRYPVYVISKGRWESRLTSKALEEMRVPYHIVVEPQERDRYAAVIDPSKIYVLPFGNLGKGSIPARNWVWDHAAASGASRHWILDDNIQWFARLHNNRLYYADSGVLFRVIEDWADRYVNVALAGMQYEAFTPRKSKMNPIILNTRIYSCILIQNDIPYRWRGRYNEDTDLSIRVMKDGWCTALFQAFPCKKMTTMSMKGGNTEELYQGDGRWRMAWSLKKQHPEIVQIKRRWGRWQHVVDYRPFRSNELVLREDAEIPEGPREYGMTLVDGEKWGRVRT